MSFGETLVQYISMEVIVRKEGDSAEENSVFGTLTTDNSTDFFEEGVLN